MATKGVVGTFVLYVDSMPSLREYVYGRPTQKMWPFLGAPRKIPYQRPKWMAEAITLQIREMFSLLAGRYQY